ncbi:MAG: methionyl-tRNA formyltransferase [Defluviitaleaceae bacterium]|nr:methionyl-tRNA formyltransferase [Defluviitaleaceae bacterium]
MKILFMGTPEFARVCLEALQESDHEIVAVFTQPDRPSGRGKKLTPPPVKVYAEERGIPVYQPEKINSPQWAITLADCHADIFVVAAYGQILSQRVLDIPKFGCVNVHASLLPKYRGAAPIQQAIFDGETLTGITIMQMDAGMDTGDMLLKREVEITQEDTGGNLHDKLCKIAPEALLTALDQIKTATIKSQKQDETQATYAGMITKEMERLDMSRPPQDVVNHIRAYNPFPGTYTEIDGKKVKIWNAKVADGKVDFLELTPPGGKKMSAEAYFRGQQNKGG